MHADGKLIASETRYLAETTDMERDGVDKPGDWDSLSDRMRKARRHQRAMQHKQQQLLQKNGAAAGLISAGTPPAAVIVGGGGGVADRKDALTERPLDFDREEQTRKGETMKWLENHFGSELSTSSSSSNGADAPPTRDSFIAPTKKTFFNVTIKSNPISAPLTINNNSTTTTSATGLTPHAVPVASSVPLLSPSKVIIPERDGEHHQHQQRQTATLERFRHHNKQLHRQHFAGGSREDLLASISRKNELNRIGLHELQEQELLHRRPHVNSSMIDLRPTSGGREYTHQMHPQIPQQHGRESRARSIDPIPHGSKILPPVTVIPLHHKEDLGYLSGSRNDIRAGGDKPTTQNAAAIANAAAAVALHRKDSGYVRGSRDDVRGAPPTSSSLQRNRLPSTNREYDASGPEENNSSAVHIVPIQKRPAVPQRRHKPGSVQHSQLQQQHQQNHHHHTQYHPEPHPDYPRSRSLTPPPSPPSSPGFRSHPQHQQQQHQLQQFPLHIAPSTTGHNSNRLPAAHFTQSTQTLNRNRPNHRKATSAPPPPSSLLLQHQQNAKSMSIIDTTESMGPNRLSSSQQQRRKSSVTAAIGNSIRKLVGRIRSVSTDRRQRSKAAKLEKLQEQQHNDQQQRRNSQSPTRSSGTAAVGGNNKSVGAHSSGSSSVNLNNNHKNGGGSTYTQYNVIDGHIGDELTAASEPESGVIKAPPQPATSLTYLMRPQPPREHHQHYRAASQVEY